ncbi:hypothetical protein [Paenibacillus sp. Soil787]|uniref:hypothetical protein n=1 Tax=Paenibacillus sp. Soil787 TaxID=1736411 RepID=UPI0012E33A0B|nr:hypothetical protein [Paenibacillus sp. Soil787]
MTARRIQKGRSCGSATRIVGLEWNTIGPVLYSGLLSNEYKSKLSFTGILAGMVFTAGLFVSGDFKL